MDQQHHIQGQIDGADHKPLSCTSIAKRLGRNPVSVSRAIKRLGIEPELKTEGGYRFYPVACLSILEAGMRARNCRKVTSEIAA